MHYTEAEVKQLHLWRNFVGTISKNVPSTPCNLKVEIIIKQNYKFTLGNMYKNNVFNYINKNNEI